MSHSQAKNFWNLTHKFVPFFSFHKRTIHCRVFGATDLAEQIMEEKNPKEMKRLCADPKQIPNFDPMKWNLISVKVRKLWILNDWRKWAKLIVSRWWRLRAIKNSLKIDGWCNFCLKQATLNWLKRLPWTGSYLIMSPTLTISLFFRFLQG